MQFKYLIIIALVLSSIASAQYIQIKDPDIGNLLAGQTWQNTSLTNNGLEHTAINQSKLNKSGDTMAGNLAMGTNDITGAGSVTADEVYSGGNCRGIRQ